MVNDVRGSARKRARGEGEASSTAGGWFHGLDIGFIGRERERRLPPSNCH
jgi:hypothetical protein